MKKRKGERERGREGKRERERREKERERKHRFAEKFITGQIKREMTKLKFATIFLPTLTQNFLQGTLLQGKTRYS